MLRKYVGAVALICMAATSAANAGSKFRTAWSFKATYKTGETFESNDTTEEEQVVPWIGSIWRCTKDPVNYSQNRTYVGGFSCRSGQSFMTVLASCYPGKVSSDANLASIGDSGGYIMLTVVCSTVEIPGPAPAKAERNL